MMRLDTVGMLIKNVLQASTSLISFVGTDSETADKCDNCNMRKRKIKWRMWYQYKHRTSTNIGPVQTTVDSTNVGPVQTSSDQYERRTKEKHSFKF